LYGRERKGLRKVEKFGGVVRKGRGRKGWKVGENMMVLLGSCIGLNRSSAYLTC
jgi:hypothetical protein